MRLKQLAIRRQPDNQFAIVASIEYGDGFVRDIALDKKTKPQDLQKAFTMYLSDEESLQVEVMARLQKIG